MFGQLPRGYVDPSALASQYPSSTKPTLPDTFVVDLRNENIVATGGGAALAIGGLVALGLWLGSRRA